MEVSSKEKKVELLLSERSLYRKLATPQNEEGDQSLKEQVITSPSLPDNTSHLKKVSIEITIGANTTAVHEHDDGVFSKTFIVPVGGLAISAVDSIEKRKPREPKWKRLTRERPKEMGASQNFRGQIRDMELVAMEIEVDESVGKGVRQSISPISSFIVPVEVGEDQPRLDQWIFYVGTAGGWTIPGQFHSSLDGAICIPPTLFFCRKQ